MVEAPRRVIGSGETPTVVRDTKLDNVHIMLEKDLEPLDRLSLPTTPSSRQTRVLLRLFSEKRRGLPEREPRSVPLRRLVQRSKRSVTKRHRPVKLLGE